jgi:hypothetical protein
MSPIDSDVSDLAPQIFGNRVNKPYFFLPPSSPSYYFAS